MLNVKFMLTYVQRGFELQLYSLHELPFLYAYLEHLYSAAAVHRKLLVAGILNSGTKKQEKFVEPSSINFDNLQEDPNTVKKRKKMTSIQKLLFDDIYYFQAMTLYSKYEVSRDRMQGHVGARERLHRCGRD
jgi:hypothetical protein